MCRLLGLSLSPCFGQLCLHVAVALAWLLHHFPSSKFWISHSHLFELSCQLISRVQPGDVRVMLDWTSVHWALAAVRWALFFFFSLLLSIAFSMRRTLSIPAPQGVRYQEPLKHVRPGCVRTPSVWDWSSYVNSAPDESAKESSCFHVHGSHLYVSLAWSFPFSLLWPTLLQARLQNLAAGWPKTDGGAENQKGGQIFKIQYWMYAATGGPNVKWRGTDFKWGAGHHWPPCWQWPCFAYM